MEKKHLKITYGKKDLESFIPILISSIFFKAFLKNLKSKIKPDYDLTDNRHQKVIRVKKELEQEDQNNQLSMEDIALNKQNEIAFQQIFLYNLF